MALPLNFRQCDDFVDDIVVCNRTALSSALSVMSSFSTRDTRKLSEESAKLFLASEGYQDYCLICKACIDNAGKCRKSIGHPYRLTTHSTLTMHMECCESNG